MNCLAYLIEQGLPELYVRLLTPLDSCSEYVIQPWKTVDALVNLFTRLEDDFTSTGSSSSLRLSPAAFHSIGEHVIVQRYVHLDGPKFPLYRETYGLLYFNLLMSDSLLFALLWTRKEELRKSYAFVCEIVLSGTSHFVVIASLILYSHLKVVCNCMMVKKLHPLSLLAPRYQTIKIFSSIVSWQSRSELESWIHPTPNVGYNNKEPFIMEVCGQSL